MWSGWRPNRALSWPVVPLPENVCGGTGRANPVVFGVVQTVTLDGVEIGEEGLEDGGRLGELAEFGTKSQSDEQKLDGFF